MMLGDFFTLKEASEVLARRGQPMDAEWLRKKVVKGEVEGAQKAGKTWFVPRKWAENYVKVKSGRPRKS